MPSLRTLVITILRLARATSIGAPCATTLADASATGAIMKC
jgi:hypothetical protein